MTKKERLKDETVLAAIIAGAMGDGRRVRRGNWGVMRFDEEKPDRSVCAVGAGCLFAGLKDLKYNPCAALAAAHGVSELYASGISDGFENSTIDSWSWTDSERADYERGVAVGKAAGVALNPQDLDYAS